MRNPRESLNIDIFVLLQKLPAIGKLMVNSKNLGATHERIGTVEHVALEDGKVIISGAEHHSAIDASAVKQIIIDRTSVMRDKCYPRIDMLGAEGDVVASVIGFDGIEPFDAALAEFTDVTALEAKEKDQSSSERKEISEEDAGLVPFKRAESEEATIRIELKLPHFHQQWQGKMPAVKPSMGFINVMVGDFHLHLKGESVADWHERETSEGVTYAAYNADQKPLGLIVTLLKAA
jgi:hypothetical protein